MHQVLTLDHTGQPRHWISCEDAVTYVAKNLVVWSLGKSIATFHGGFQKDGHQSIIETPPIILNSREKYTIFSRVYESRKRNPQVINKHVNPNGYSCSSENQARNYRL